MNDDTKLRGEPCTCNYLQGLVDRPEFPIGFDDESLMYRFTYQEPDCEGPSMLLIYHCPFCGGAAPRSKSKSP